MTLENNVLKAAENKYLADVEETEFFLVMIFPTDTKINVEDYHEVDTDYAIAKIKEKQEKQRKELEASLPKFDFNDLGKLPENSDTSSTVETNPETE